MIIDTSAIIAILYRETKGTACLGALEQSSAIRLSAASLLEASIVKETKGDAVGTEDLDQFLLDFHIVIEPVTEAQARIARQAYRQFGKGRGHPARLNFGDCFAYALARDRNEPLLFVGNDFSHTDIRSALPDERDLA